MPPLVRYKIRICPQSGAMKNFEKIGVIQWPQALTKATLEQLTKSPVKVEVYQQLQALWNNDGAMDENTVKVGVYQKL